MSINNMILDALDRNIINLLLEDGLMTNAMIGEKIGLSSSAVNERIRKLRTSNIIKKTSICVDASCLNLQLGAFIFVLIDGGTENNKSFLENASLHPNVLECHHVTGEYSYLLKVRVEDTKKLEEFITEFLKTQKGVTQSLTQVILSSSKDLSNIS